MGNWMETVRWIETEFQAQKLYAGLDRILIIPKGGRGKDLNRDFILLQESTMKYSTIENSSGKQPRFVKFTPDGDSFVVLSGHSNPEVLKYNFGKKKWDCELCGFCQNWEIRRLAGLDISPDFQEVYYVFGSSLFCYNLSTHISERYSLPFKKAKALKFVGDDLFITSEERGGILFRITNPHVLEIGDTFQALATAGVYADLGNPDRIYLADSKGVQIINLNTKQLNYLFLKEDTGRLRFISGSRGIFLKITEQSDGSTLYVTDRDGTFDPIKIPQKLQEIISNSAGMKFYFCDVDGNLGYLDLTPLLRWKENNFHSFLKETYPVHPLLAESGEIIQCPTCKRNDLLREFPIYGEILGLCYNCGQLFACKSTKKIAQFTEEDRLFWWSILSLIHKQVSNR